MELAVRIIKTARKLLKEQHNLHLRETYKEQIFASHNDDTGVSIDTIVFQAQEGLIHVNKQNICLITAGGVGKTLYRYKDWNEFLEMEETK